MNRCFLFIIPIILFILQLLILPKFNFFKKYDEEKDKIIILWGKVIFITFITTIIFILLCILSIIIYDRIENSKRSSSSYKFDKTEEKSDCEVGVNEYDKYKNSKVGKFVKTYPSNVIDICGEDPEFKPFFPRKRKAPKDDLISHYSNELGKAVKEKKSIIECMKISQAPASEHFNKSIRNVNDRILGYSALMDSGNLSAADYENTKEIVERYVKDYIIKRPGYINSNNKKQFIKDYIKELSVKYPNKYNATLLNELIEMEYNINLNKFRKDALNCNKTSTLYKRSKEISDDIYRLDNKDDMLYLCRQNEAIDNICKDSDGNEDKKCSTFYEEYCDNYIKMKSDKLLPEI